MLRVDPEPFESLTVPREIEGRLFLPPLFPTLCPASVGTTEDGRAGLERCRRVNLSHEIPDPAETGYWADSHFRRRLPLHLEHHINTHQEKQKIGQPGREQRRQNACEPQGSGKAQNEHIEKTDRHAHGNGQRGPALLDG
jgi:hypothetical protein